MFGVATNALRAHRRDHVVGDEAVSAFRDHHRIDHQERQVEVVHSRRHGFHDRGRGQHPRLYRVDADIRRDRLDLRGHQIR
jgi:hypothetical protein